MNRYKTILLAFILPVLALSIGIPVLAEDNNTSTDTSQIETAKRAAEAKREATKQAAEAKREAAKQVAEKQREAVKQAIEKQREASKNELELKKDKLKEDKLKVCQEKEDHISGSMTNVATRGQDKIALFTKISDRTEAFYATKGKILANYSELVATVNSQKAAAQTAVDTVFAGSDDFKCDSDNPKATANLFKVDVKAMNEALKNYRTAVKDLIVGVKSVQSTSSEGTN